MSKKISVDLKNIVIEMHNKGYSNSEIGSKLKLSRNTIAKILKDTKKPEDKIDVSSLLKGMDMLKSEAEKMEYLLDSIINLYYSDEYFRNKMHKKLFYHMKVKEYQFLERMLKYSKQYKIDLDTIASWVNVISKLKSIDITPSEIIALAENQVTIKKQRDEISKNLQEIENLKSQIAKIQQDIKYSYKELGGIKNYK
ncbi:MAG: helix-turn-helix domain-containing protein, partial [Candidatus Nanopusillus acidilobi]